MVMFQFTFSMFTRPGISPVNPIRSHWFVISHHQKPMKHSINPIKFHKIPVGLAVKYVFFFHSHVSLPEGNPTSLNHQRAMAKALLLQCRRSIKGIQCWHQDGLRQWQTLLGSAQRGHTWHDSGFQPWSYRYLTLDIQRYRSIYPAIYLSIYPSIHPSIHLQAAWNGDLTCTNQDFINRNEG